MATTTFTATKIDDETEPRRDVTEWPQIQRCTFDVCICTKKMNEKIKIKPKNETPATATQADITKNIYILSIFRMQTRFSIETRQNEYDIYTVLRVNRIIYSHLHAYTDGVRNTTVQAMSSLCVQCVCVRISLVLVSFICVSVCVCLCVCVTDTILRIFFL